MAADKFHKLKNRESCGNYDPQSVQWVGDTVVVEREKVAAEIGGIAIPEHLRKPIHWGRVVAIGNSLTDNAKDLRVGHRVATHGHAMIRMRFTWQDKTHDVVGGDDIEIIDATEG